MNQLASPVAHPLGGGSCRPVRDLLVFTTGRTRKLLLKPPALAEVTARRFRHGGPDARCAERQVRSIRQRRGSLWTALFEQKKVARRFEAVQNRLLMVFRRGLLFLLRAGSCQT